MSTRQWQPPKFGKDDTYQTWKNKIDMWKTVTDLPKAKQGIVVLLQSLEGNVKAEKAISDLTADELNVDGGLDILIEKLDTAFRSENTDEAYGAYTKFNSFVRSPELPMVDYILEFEHRYAGLAKYDMKLPDTVLAFKILDGACLTEEQRQLVLAVGSDLKLGSMKSGLKRIFSRHNRIITETLLKVKEANSCDWETALAWSISAKNGLINVKGFSPNQLVFGRNINLPSVIQDKLPALEGVSISMNVARNILALHFARKAFIESESSEKIRRALRKQTRQTFEGFVLGEEVFYKRDDQQKWKGPGKVIGQDGPIIFIRHGGQYIKAHSCRVQHVRAESSELSLSKEKETQITHDLMSSNTEKEVIKQDTDEDDTVGKEVTSGVIDENVFTLSKDKIVTFSNDGIEYEVKIISRAGKATGIYKNRFNVEYYSPDTKKGHIGFVDFDQMENLKEKEGKIIKDSFEEEKSEDILVTKSVDFSEAKNSELQSWKDNCVYQEIDNNGQRTISVRWVCSFKTADSGLVPKARLVARGFEENSDDIMKESPTCSKDSLRLLLAVVAQKHWNLNTIDIKTAFLQGKGLDRNVLLKPPKEACTDKLWKLKKCVYGLSDASLKWYERLKDFMINHNAKMSTSDSAVFYLYHDGILQGILGMHVDDIIWAGTLIFEKMLISKLRSTFQISQENNEAFKYLGLDVQQAGGEIKVDQNLYIDNLGEIKIKSDGKIDLMPDEIDLLRSSIGQLLWTSNQTRPDVSYDVCQLATCLTNGKKKDLRYANKIIRKLKTERLSLKYKHLGKDSSLKIVVFADAAHGNLRDGGSQGGNLVFLVGENGICSLLSWQSKRIRRVVRSTLAAETLSMSDAIDNAVFIKCMFSEIYFNKTFEIPIIIVTDNKSLCDALQSNKNVSNKRLRIEIGMLKEMIQRKEICSVKWVESEKQLADVLTKHGASSQQLRRVIDYGNLEI